MMGLKRLWKRDGVRYFLFSFVLALIFLALKRPSGFFTALSDLFFFMGAVHIVTACVRYISNVGLFKTFSYMAYKMRWKRTGRQHGEAHPMSLAEYTVNVIYDEDRQRPVGQPLLVGLACWAASVLLVFVGIWI